MLSGQKLISWEISSNVPTHGRARFQHAEGFFLDFDINVPRDIPASDRPYAFAIELNRAAIKVRDYDVEEGKRYAQEWIDAIAEDRRAGYSAD